MLGFYLAPKAASCNQSSFTVAIWGTFPRQGSPLQSKRRAHLWERHPIDNKIRLLGSLTREGVVVVVVGAGVPVVLVLYVEKGAFRSAATQWQSLLVVIKVVEGRGQGRTADNVHFISLLYIPGH